MRALLVTVMVVHVLAGAGCAKGRGMTIPGDADSDTDSGADGPVADGPDGDGACIPGAVRRCVDGAVVSFDSCDVEEGLLYECGAHGECVEEVDGAARCRCDDGWLGGECGSCGTYVDVDVPAGGDGTSWQTAFDTIQAGIDAAHELLGLPGAPEECEVWVAEGTYYVHAGSEADTVLLRARVKVYGGFSGEEVDRSERDFAAHVTRIDGADGPGGSARVHHVVTGANEARLDGFIVAGGAADGDYPHDRGAGVYCWDASPVLANCGFTGNSAAADGAAVGGWEGSGPTISGGVFTGNTAGNDGGGVFVSGGSLHLSGCIFSSNAAGDDGGAVAVYDGATATVESCVFSGNTAANGGGAVFTRESDTSLVNCTVTGNSASDGAGAWNEDGTLTVVNSIFWGDDGEEMGHSSAGWGTTSHSDVQGGAEGTGNIDADPLFTGPGEVRLSSGSPCIDAADGDAAPERDLAGNERVDDPATADTGTGSPPWVDMGALEHQP